MDKEQFDKVPNYEEIEIKGKRLEALINLSARIRENERRQPIPFNDFLYLCSTQPKLVFRSIFQFFHDMAHYYVPEGVEEYKDAPDSVGFKGYDMTDLFVSDCDNPFFADRIFANRLMNLIERFRESNLHNHIFLFEGPPGSGKSTFLNNLLLKLESYSRSNEGALFETYWKLDVERLGGFRNLERGLRKVSRNEDVEEIQKQIHRQKIDKTQYPERFVEFSCPNRDHPILQIPKSYRRRFLEELIPDEEFKQKLFHRREYEWALKENPCHICQSLHSTILDNIGDPLEVFAMAGARRARFNRQFGEGVSVFNPGDPVFRKSISNPALQSMINNLLRTDAVDFVYSYLAKTNNGALALMDIKESNIERLKSLHGVISDGAHKVELIEERINTLFVGLVNPEDKVHFENVKSFQDRIISVNIPYVLDYRTEVAIYKNKFGSSITKKFLPRVLHNFAKIVISSRMDKDSPVMRQWITDSTKYRKYIDQNLLLLKMELYTGVIPSYLTDSDVKRFDKKTRKELLRASENEGKRGYSGRQSINVFGTFLSKYAKNDKKVTMECVKEFFQKQNDKDSREIPTGFVDSIEALYDYNVIQEIKEAIYHYNEDQIKRDLKNYLFAINYDVGETKISEFTGDEIDIDDEFFKRIESVMLGAYATEAQRKNFRSETHREYISTTLSREMSVQKKDLTETTQFEALFEKYIRNMKENALSPYVSNKNFRRAALDYKTEQFKTYDSRVRADVERMIENLVKKFEYDEKGAVQICVYAIDKNLANKYA